MCFAGKCGADIYTREQVSVGMPYPPDAMTSALYHNPVPETLFISQKMLKSRKTVKPQLILVSYVTEWHWEWQNQLRTSKTGYFTE